jgi:hypothetical protein
VDANLEEYEASGAEIRRQIESQPGYAELRDRLRTRMAAYRASV